MTGGDDARGEVDRRALVHRLIAEQTPTGESLTTVVHLSRLCRATVGHLSAHGAAVSLMSASGSEGVAASADDQSVLLDELQFSLLEGPSLDAFRMRRPVLVPDLSSPDGNVWPLYRSAATEVGVRGVFALPLHVGASAFGVLTLYTDVGLPLGRDHLRTLLTFAEIATEILLDGNPPPGAGGLHPGVEAMLGHRAEIYQAQGVITVKLDISLAEAMARMRAHAFSHGQTLAELAALIMSGAEDLSTSGDD